MLLNLVLGLLYYVGAYLVLQDIVCTDPLCHPQPCSEGFHARDRAGDLWLTRFQKATASLKVAT